MMGGVFMYAVHILAGKMPKAEYGVFTTMLQILNLMGIPAIGLQSVFAQQAAAALTEEQRRELSGTTRAVMAGIFVIWVLMAAPLVMLHDRLVLALQVTHPSALWFTLLLGLGALWFPIMCGVLQGRQNFLWYGNVYIMNGVGRFAAIFVLVYLLGGLSPSAVLGAFIGLATATGLGAWQNRFCWTDRAIYPQWKPWLARVVPLTLGAGATMFMMSADMIFVQRYFDRNETGFYAAAGMIGRALIFFTIPISAVMFPKVVASAAKSEKTNVVFLSLGATALLGASASIFCTIFPELPLRLVYDKSFLKVAPLVPWFVWCMLPLTLVNVLANNLLARQRYGVVPWLVLLAVAYAGVLEWQLPALAKGPDLIQSFSSVVQILGLFSLLLLTVCLVFTWLDFSRSKVVKPS